jgi:hypothetical protein
MPVSAFLIRRAVPGTLLFAMACAHSPPTAVTNPARLGPSSNGADIQLTFNTGEDYWPTYTEDGQGILYQYSQPGDPADNRCIGLLPAGGGTRLWSLCDTRVTQVDSVHSFAAYALGDDGRLLYLEAVSPIHAEAPLETALWLADSAHPFQRRLLTALPARIGDSVVDWLSDARWTGPTTFVALAQGLSGEAHCHFCTADDTIFTGLYVVTGTITSSGVTLAEVQGTEGATEFGVSSSSGTILYSKATDLMIHEVQTAGGTPTTDGSLPTSPGRTILGLSCVAARCVAATSAVSLPPGGPVSAGGGLLWSVDLTSQAVTQLAEPTANILWASAQLAPNGHDVVLQVNGALGNQRLTGDTRSDLHLLQGVVP